mmetsp:Transcript_9216/g.27282  ORF Transcript_9216/g.27282 Transcript_9216/m.27282 type:complete len:183 (+) Transcript_9216:66-614(+)
MAAAGGTLLTSSTDGALKRRSEAEPLLAAVEVDSPVVAFCRGGSPLQPDPSPEELEELWAQCRGVSPEAAAEALCGQLAWSPGDDWRPRLRALCALGFFHRQGGEARSVSKRVTRTGGGLVQRLVQVPECRAKASRLVLVLFGDGAVGAARAETLPRVSSVGSIASLASAGSEDEAEVRYFF